MYLTQNLTCSIENLPDTQLDSFIAETFQGAHNEERLLWEAGHFFGHHIGEDHPEGFSKKRCVVFFLSELCPCGLKHSAISHFVAVISAKVRGGAV